MCNACLAAGLSRRAMLGAGLAAMRCRTACRCRAGAADESRRDAGCGAEAPGRRQRPLRLEPVERARLLGHPGSPCARARSRSPRSSAAPIRGSAPELAFDQPPGDLFVVRVAGNFVTTAGLGSPGIRRRRARYQGDHGAGPHELRCGRRHRRGAAEGQHPARTHRRPGAGDEARASNRSSNSRARTSISARSSPMCGPTSGTSPKPSRSWPRWWRPRS